MVLEKKQIKTLLVTMEQEYTQFNSIRSGIPGSLERMPKKNTISGGGFRVRPRQTGVQRPDGVNLGAGEA